MPWLTQASIAIVIIAAGGIAGLALYGVMSVVTRMRRLNEWSRAADPFVTRCRGGVRVLLPLVGAYAALPFALQGDVLERTALGGRILLILACSYVLVRAIYGAEDFIVARLDLDQPDNLDARRLHTQLRVLKSILVSLLVFAVLITLILYLPGARQIGAGLIASAGLAGLLVGFAAQRVLANLLAGFQIAVTQPIRLDDVVVVEGEWGRIEEITLTYVVVRIWDDRRLVLPVSYFLDNPFTNWTRQSADILGTVYLHTDYHVPLDELRGELDRVLAESEWWDGRVSGLVVTDCKDTTLELRALVSARDGGEAWNLRCEVREKLVRYLQENHPESLPRLRAEVVANA